ncbi:hypothetical protein [Paenibacillus daejeonensis]|uniref:hypothetical protein n=1 Tax=Paenibacillus daejeonensis TaxID=135193 RepID=UPI0003790C58|nr:hypothetical protein [Paenibacillus daejeonensis]
MKARWRQLLMLGVLGIGLSGCGGEPAVPIDPALVEATVRTEPAPASSGTPVTLVAEFTGAEITDRADVTLDIRVEGEPVLIDATYDGEGGFEATYTFADPGSYETFVHLYVDDLHLTKKAQVDVQ